MSGISKSLEQKLVTDGGLDADSLQLALEQSKAANKKLLDQLVAGQFIDPGKLAILIGSEYAIPIYDIEAHNIELSPTDLVDHKLIKKHKALPLFKRGNRLFIAVGDPTNHQAVSDIRFQSGLSVEVVVAEIDKLDAAIDRFFKSQEKTSVSPSAKMPATSPI